MLRLEFAAFSSAGSFPRLLVAPPRCSDKRQRWLNDPPSPVRMDNGREPREDELEPVFPASVGRERLRGVRGVCVCVYACVPLSRVRKCMYTRICVYIVRFDEYARVTETRVALKARFLRESHGGCPAEKMNYVIIE